MTYYVEVPVDDGAAVLVEVTNQVDGVVPAGRSQEVIARLSETFDDAFDRFSRLARGAAARARDAGGADRVTVEFGLKVAAKGGFVVAETTGEAHLKLTFEWNRRADRTPATAPASEPDGNRPDEMSAEPTPETTAGSLD
ncbi:CU044_2847 family protein [Plantactinospora sp. WMMB334]|uniref:CU044_2847 family protein n=1 Tax=Plantactinospora sp. WMMB334 TaxID=3404119 RepID=UPI003B95BE43